MRAFETQHSHGDAGYSSCVCLVLCLSMWKKKGHRRLFKTRASCVTLPSLMPKSWINVTSRSMNLIYCTRVRAISISWRCHGSTHSSCHACGARCPPSCCSPVSWGLAPSPCTSSGSVHGTPPAATAARSGLNRCTNETLTTLHCPASTQAAKQDGANLHRVYVIYGRGVRKQGSTGDVKKIIIIHLLQSITIQVWLISSTIKCNYTIDCYYYL